ncbi:MAG: extracellular solute-binding protein, partial [Anaerolineae bacterium]|nr:extracellular solute-binding protein [Anaerolineae bacterium]
MTRGTHHLKSLLLLTLLLMLVFPAAQPSVAAQATPAIILSLPGTYEDFITAEVLASFEAQYNVRVHIEYGTAFSLGGGGQQAVTATLENAAELAASADVVYVDQTTLTPAATQAGYFLNLAPLTSSDPTLNIHDFYPAVWQSFQWDQGIWALPTAADVVLVTYDPARFDMAGVAYPNERWTIDDFASAARALSTYDATGSVLTPGITAGTPASTLPYLLVALTGHGFYDDTVAPNQPTFGADLEYILQIWAELEAEGVVTTSFFRGGEGAESSPLRIEGTMGFSGRFAADENAAQRQASLLPGGTAGLSASGFAVSSGTLYPELSYALASHLTTLPELASANFTSSTAARQSLAGIDPLATENGNGGGPGGFNARNLLNVPEQIQAVIDQAIYTAMPGAEVRYSSYVTAVINQINSGAGDALSLLQEAEVSAIADVQAAVTAASTTNVIVASPPQDVVLVPGEITLNCAINTGFGDGPGQGGNLPNEEVWDSVIAEFAASDPLIGSVNFEPVTESDLAVLASGYDCFILPSNAVQGSDVSLLLNLDPLLDTDPGFNRNDILPGVLTQLQQNAQTWAMPLAIQPSTLSYSPTLLAQAGVPEPVNGWTVAGFMDALTRLDLILDDDTAPFTPNDPSGSYLLQLVGAFGGLPIDYRTDPPALNFTDANTVSAIQQVLDLAVNGYMDYSGVA